MSKNTWVAGLLVVFAFSVLAFNGGTANAQVACTMDAKMCPDGSYVGRSGPSCQFAACPSGTNTLFTATPTSGPLPLKVTFKTNYGDNSTLRPSASDAQDTMIDFGDGTEKLWVQCKVATGTTTKKCGFVTSDNKTTLEHTYAQKGNYVAKIIKTGGRCAGTCPTTELSKVSITVGSPTPYAATDISKVTLKSFDPVPQAVDDEYGEYTIKLKNNTTFTLVAHFFTGGIRLTQLKETGYTGTLEQFTALVEEPNRPPTPPSNPPSSPTSNGPAILFNYQTSGRTLLVEARFRKTSTSTCNQANYGSIDWGDGKNDKINITRCDGNSWLVGEIDHLYPSGGGSFDVVIKDLVKNKTITEKITISKNNSFWYVGFFKRVAAGLNNTFNSVVNYFFPGRAAEIAKRQFSDLPATANTYKGGTRLKTDIDAIIINKTASNAECSAPYQAYILTIQPPEVGVTGCSTGTTLDNYLQSIADQLKQHSFEPLTVTDLKSLPVYLGDIDSGLTGITNTGTPATPTGNSNALGLEVKVKNKNGLLVQDWVKGNPTIGPTDQIFLRWNVAGYAQCLPFVADNGNYALTRPAANSKMLSGNTETENYNLLERSGLYYIECSDTAGEDVEVGSILVTVTENATQHGIDLGASEKFKVTVDKTNPLKVNVTYTNDKATCNPKYVGKIDWGDNSTTFEPDYVTQECGAGKTATTSHSYSSAKAYQISIARGGVQKHKETIHLGGSGTTNFSAKPTSGSAPLNVEFKFNSKNVTSIDFGDTKKETITCTANTTCGERKVLHTYTANGNYQATITEKDGSKKTIPILVSNNALGATPTSGVAPLKVSFNFNQTGSSLLIYGDGSKSEANDCSGGGSCTLERSHTYKTPGTYEARLITGCSSTANASCTVEAKVQKAKIVVTGNTTSTPSTNCRTSDLDWRDKISCWTQKSPNTPTVNNCPSELSLAEKVKCWTRKSTNNNGDYQNNGPVEQTADGNWWSDKLGNIRNFFSNYNRGGSD